MRPTSQFVTLAAATVLAMVPATAQAARPQTTDVSVRSYDSASVVTAGSFSFAGLTTGTPYDGPSTTTVTALDGSLPSASTCEPGSISVTASATGGAQLTVTANGDLCASFSGTAHTIFAGFRTGDVEVAGSDRVRVVREGFVSASLGSILPGSGQMSLSATLAG
jgi:hypothetical protein